METTTVENDIEVFYVTAKSFPDGVLEAHNKLHQLVPFSADRNYFGISRPEGGPIVYRAGTGENTLGEAKRYDCETLILRKGKYVSLTLKNFRKDPRQIEKAFEELLASPDIDPKGYCVEWYSNEDESVKCMVRTLI